MKVVIVGGTHGNEKTGLYLLEKWRRSPGILPSTHEYLLLEGNPKAAAANQRYLDFDLNRSFNGGNTKPESQEFIRAQELQNIIQTWANADPYFLIDLHTTTSNMGCTLVLSHSDWLSAWVIKSTNTKINDSKVLFSNSKHFLIDIAPHGLLVEVGPVPQNLYNSQIVEMTESAVLAALNALASAPSIDHREHIQISGYAETGATEYPIDESGHQISMIHSELQGRDYHPLKSQMPIFEMLDGSTLCYKETETIYPVFINEAAYYDKNIAYLSTRKVTLTFSASP